MFRTPTFFALLGCLVSLATADQTTLKAVKITNQPTIDGVINDDEWKDIPAIEGMHDGLTGADYGDGGKFWLGYDKDFVYFAAKLKESDPKAIRATEYRTNVGLSGDDYVELDLDLSGSLTAFNVFQVNPLGGTNIQIAGGRAAKREWLGAFVAKSRITDTGWEAEARIPWQCMNIPRGGARNLRFNIARYISKNQRRFNFAYVPSSDTGQMPTWLSVDLPKPYVDHSIKLLPYAYAGYDPNTKQVLNAGLDMKTALAEQINLVGTINPDFRNIENQILSIDFSRFERLAGETRPFFQEGANYSNSAIFASQRIRAFDVGVNTYGRLNDTMSFSLINTTDFGRQNDAIFNLTFDPSPNDSLRISTTSREQPGLSNEAYLVRYSKNVGDYNLFLREMGSKDTTFGFGRQSDIFVSYFKTGLNFSGGWTRSEDEFRPRLGFFQEVDYVGPNLSVNYNRNYDHGLINDWGLSLFGVSYDHLNGDFYRNEQFVSLFTTLRPLGFAIVGAADLADFEGSHDSLYTLNLSVPRGNPYRHFGFQIDSGRQAGIPYKSWTGNAAWRFNKKLQLAIRHQSVEYAGHSDQTILTANYDLGGDRSISGRAVRQGSSTNAYVAYRRSGNEGIEYFLILGDPNAQTYRNSLILKVAVPLSIGKRKVAPETKKVSVISGPKSD